MAENQGGFRFIRQHDPSNTGGVELPAGAGQMGGTMPGLNTTVALGADVTPVLGALALRRGQTKKPAKDYDDKAAATTMGVNRGNPVKDQPPI